MAGRIDHAVSIACTRELAFQVFSDWEHWHDWFPMLSNPRWTEGKPWAVDSRLELDLKITLPAPLNIKYVITDYSPPAKVTWFNHAMGIVDEQQVSFETQQDGRTQVRCVIDFAGAKTEIMGVDIVKLKQGAIEKWLVAMKTECERRAAAVKTR